MPENTVNATEPSTASGSCCGAAGATNDAPPAEPCCGSTADAAEAGSCCAPAAKTEAVAAGASCCG